jgi:hypothetical protein
MCYPLPVADAERYGLQGMIIIYDMCYDVCYDMLCLIHHQKLLHCDAGSLNPRIVRALAHFCVQP